MTEFVALFGKLVLPDLVRLCRVQALLIALDSVAFDEAYGAVMQEARRRGSTRLPAKELEDLEDYLLSTILKYEDEFRPSVLARRVIADRVADDIARTEAKWHEIWSSEGT